MNTYEIRCPACGLVVSVSNLFIVTPHVSEGRRCAFKSGKPGEVRSLHAELAYEIFSIRNKFGIKEPSPLQRGKKKITGKRGGKRKKKYPISHSFMDRSGLAGEKHPEGHPGLGNTIDNSTPLQFAMDTPWTHLN